jgi:hypothetical protein
MLIFLACATLQTTWSIYMFSRSRNSQFYWRYYLPYLTISSLTNYWQEIRKRGLKVSVAGVPKTIDNDIAVIFCKICLLSMQKPSLHSLLIWPFIWECDMQISCFLDHRQVFWFWYGCGRGPACHWFSSRGSLQCWEWNRFSKTDGSL